LSEENGDQLVLERLRKRGLTGMTLAVFQHYLASRGIVPSEDDFDSYLKRMRAEKVESSS
jgi:hypothetical protein